jgi:hypothetical protein
MKNAKGEYTKILGTDGTANEQWLAQQTVEMPSDDYDDFKEKSGQAWDTLPTSVIGTLLYFIMVEQNSPNFDLYFSLKACIFIGFSTYMCYFLQYVMIIGLWNSVFGPEAEEIWKGICGISPLMLTAAICVYWISMIPSFNDMISTTDIILFCKRFAYTQDDDKVYVTNMLATPAKRVIVFLLVNVIEMGIIIGLSIAGVGYLLTSDDVQDLLMNSVSIVFILQIDDMARDAFQSDEISSHIDGMEFERTMKIPKISDMSTNGKIRQPTWATYKTFWTLDKALFTFIVSLVCVYPVIYYMCWSKGLYHYDDYVETDDGASSSTWLFHGSA